MGQVRAFIAIKVTPLPIILNFEQDIENTGAKVKLVEPENIHITLKFLGDIDEEIVPKVEQIIKEVVTEYKPFTLKLKGTGFFPNRNYLKVLWVGIHDTKALETLASDLNKQLVTLGFKQDRRGFSPHLTIGRVKSAKNKNLLLNIVEQYHDVDFGEETVSSIKFMKSTLTPQGPIYSVLREISI
jgi:2'-5' RNA ligase